jgi:predicted MFS family arabinose efflux permease
MPRLNPVTALRSAVPERGPRRTYLVATLINIVGFGLIVTAMTLFGTRVIHLSTAKTGLALTIAGLAGLLAAIPMGALADRRGPREMLRLSQLVLAAAAFSYLFIHTFTGFLIVAIVDVSATNSSLAADGALLRRVGGEEAVTFRARAQAVINLGISLGVVGTGVAVQINTPAAYRALFLVHGVTCVADVVALSRLPRFEPLPGAHEGSPLAALRDKAFVVYTVLSGLMFMQYFVPIFLLPLWIVYHTHAPRWTVSLIMLINTVLVVLFQVRIGKRVVTVRQGGAALRRAGVIFLFSCSVMGLATGIPALAAFAVLAVAIALHTYGELWHASASFALEYGLAPAHAQGQYQGLIGVGNGAGQAAAPVVLIGLFLSLGRLGFILLGVCFAVLGQFGPLVARWGERTRPAPAEPEQVAAAD